MCMRKLLGAVLAVGLAACGSAEKQQEPFDAGVVYPWCQYAENEGRAKCSLGSTLLVCVKAVERRYACTGQMGCNANGGSVFCDFSLSSEGDSCPPYNEGQALCAQDGGVALKCVDGGFVSKRCAGGCSVSGGAVYCP